MRILLDTQAFLWLMTSDRRLSTRAQAIFEDLNNILYLSLGSVWEMAIKSSLGKLQLPLPINEYVSQRCVSHDIVLMEMAIHHLQIVEELPFYHRDPFDRLLVSQAIAEGIPILSYDKQFLQYPVECIWK